MNNNTPKKYGYFTYNPITNKGTPCSIEELQKELGIGMRDIYYIVSNRLPIKDKGYLVCADIKGKDFKEFLSIMYPNEKWETLDRFCGKYEVSNYGRVRYKSKTPDSSPCLMHYTRKSDKRNYVVIYEDKKQIRVDVDKLVAYHFVEKRELLEDEEIVHLDGDNKNNYYRNLQIKKFKFDKQLKLMEEAYKKLILEDDDLYPNERWKPLNREKSPYQISDYGRIRKPQDNGEWYYLKQVRKGKSNVLQVVISANGKRTCESISRLVAEHFLEDFSPEKSIFHIDLNKDNNYYLNLQCEDKSSVGKKTAIMARNLPKVVCTDALTGERIGVYNSAREAGRMLGVSRQTVSDNLNGKTKVALKKYKFTYEEERVT